MSTLVCTGISHQLEQMVTALKVSTCPNDEVHNRQYNNINAIFLDCMDKLKVCE